MAPEQTLRINYEIKFFFWSCLHCTLRYMPTTTVVWRDQLVLGHSAVRQPLFTRSITSVCTARQIDLSRGLKCLSRGPYWRHNWCRYNFDTVVLRAANQRGPCIETCDSFALQQLTLSMYNYEMPKIKFLQNQWSRAYGIVFGACFLRRDATQSAVLLRQVVRPAVRPSVRDVEVSWSHRLEFFEKNNC